MISLSTEGPVLRILLSRPEKKNALTPGMYNALSEAFSAAGTDAGIGAILIEGSGGSFCAGNDVSTLASVANGGTMDEVFAFLRVLCANEKPIVAAVDGPAIGIGTTMLMHCDHVIASTRSVFATPFVDLGIVPEAGSSLLAPRLMGERRAYELLVMGRRFSAPEAAAAGLISTVVDDENVAAHALGICHALAAKPRGALSMARRLVRPAAHEVLARIEQEADLFGQCLLTVEAQAAFKAFLSRSGP